MRQFRLACLASTMLRSSTIEGSGGSSTLTGAQQQAATVEGDVNAFLPIIAGLIPGAGAGIAAGVTGAEAVTNTILAATASHAPALTIASGAVGAVVANAAPVIAALPEADQATGNTVLGDLEAAIKAAEDFFAGFKL